NAGQLEKTMFKFVTALFFLGLCPSAFAGSILAQGVIYNVGNSTGNPADNFAIFVKSTTAVPCPEGYGIVFFASSAPYQKAYDRSFAMALTALTAGQKVIIYSSLPNATSSDCSSAAYITIQTN